MRLVGWHVEGFGLLHDFRVADLPGGLTVVLGPNEAGKTALLAFIRGALFGYPDRRKRDHQYPPLRGGRHGGRLFVESQGSIWTIERFASPSHLSITQPEGALGTETDLRRLLGGVDAELHRNVFAFSLSELQEFGTLQVEGVRDRIFAAGVVGAGRSARAAIEMLIDQRAEIGRRRGNCRISTLRDRVDELDELLRQAKARAARHPELRRATDEADEERKRIGHGLTEARHEMARLDTLLSVWPDWDELTQAKAELETVAATPELPEEFGTRLESSLVTARTQRKRHEEQQRTVLNLEQQLAALVPDERLAAVSADVKRFGARTGIVRARRERLEEIHIQCEGLRGRVEEEAARLGPGWTSRSVRKFDTSIPAAQEIANWGDRLRAAEQEVRDAEREATQLESLAQALRDETSRRAEVLKLQPPLPEWEYLNNSDAAVRRVRAKLPQIAALRAERAAAAERVADAERRLSVAQTAAADKESELERRSAAFRSAPELPDSEDLGRRERAVRELRIGLAEFGIARSDLRAANQRALDAKQRAEEAELSASADEKEVERRSAALAEQRPVPDAETLATRSRAARELRLRLVDLTVLRSDLRSAELRLADRRREAERPPPVRPLNHRRALFASAGVLCAVALALALVSQFVAAVVALAAAIVTAIVAMTLPAAASTAPGAASIGIAEVQRDINELRERIQKIETSAWPLAATLEFTSLPDQAELETRADELAAQTRASEDRDRAAAGVEELRAHAQRIRDIAQRLRTAANNAQSEVDNVVLQHLRNLDADNRIPATALGLTELPTVVALEEQATELRDLTQKRRDRDREASALRALELEVARARDVAARIEQELSDMTRVESTLATRIRAAEESTLVVAVLLGFSVIPEPADLEAKAKEIDDAVRAREERDRNATEIEGLGRRTITAETLTREAGEKAARCRRDRDALHEEWAEWKVEHRCPEPLRPETAQHFFASVERLRESLAQIDRMDAESAIIQAEIDEFSQSVRPLVEQASIPAPGSPLAEDVLDALRERVETDMGLRAEHARMAQNLETARSALVTSERDAVAAENALARLLEEAWAADERECRARIAASRHRAELNKQVRDAEHRLRSRLGVGADANAVRADLATGDRQGWEARKQTCKATLARLQPEYEEALRRHQTAVETLSSLERESDIAVLAIEREGVIAEIHDALSEWRRLAIAESLVQRTLRRYEVERQPAVLNRAAASFSRITAGRYTRLAAREDGIDLITSDGQRLDAALLSRGTAEQLYLCLRLALAEEFGRLAVQLPLVMDDVLVNFDPERARLAADVLLDAARGHQVLLFTCHPETVDLLIDVAPDVKVIEIERQIATAPSIERIALEVGSGYAALQAGTSRQADAVAGPGLAEAVLAAIRAAGRPLSRADILSSTGMLEAHWTAVIQELRGRGLVISHGRKRGTTWGLADWALPAEDEN